VKVLQRPGHLNAFKRSFKGKPFKSFLKVLQRPSLLKAFKRSFKSLVKTFESPLRPL